MSVRLFAFAIASVLAGVQARPTLAQETSDVVLVQSAVLNAIRGGSPRVWLLVHDASRASEARAISRLTGVRVVELPATGRVRAAGADTISVVLTVKSIAADTAVVTVDESASLISKTKDGPTVWWTQQRAYLMRKGGLWVTKLETLMES